MSYETAKGVVERPADAQPKLVGSSMGLPGKLGKAVAAAPEGSGKGQIDSTAAPGNLGIPGGKQINLLASPLSVLFGKTVGFVFGFIPIDILCRILFKYLHPWLPCLKWVHRMLHAGGEQAPATLDGRPAIHNGKGEPRVQDDPKPSTF